MVLHRMQLAIQAFLRYHGLDTGPLLQAYSCVASQDGGSQTFGERETGAALLGAEPGAAGAAGAETALSWVLYALFSYSRDIGLKPGPFG